MEMDLSPHWEYYFALVFFSSFNGYPEIDKPIDGRVDISISTTGSWGLLVGWKP